MTLNWHTSLGVVFCQQNVLLRGNFSVNHLVLYHPFILMPSPYNFFLSFHLRVGIIQQGLIVFVFPLMKVPSSAFLSLFHVFEFGNSFISVAKAPCFHMSEGKRISEWKLFVLSDCFSLLFSAWSSSLLLSLFPFRLVTYKLQALIWPC